MFRYNTYCSNRGTIGRIQKIYNVVREALKRGTEAIKPGETAKSIDDITRDYITEHGYGQYFGHSTGHGLGLEIHEPLRLSQESKVTYKKVWLLQLSRAFTYRTGAVVELKTISSLQKKAMKLLQNQIGN